uniref:Uncharacterized protein n=1 Tax=Anopheles dirus TaxID=7168 RepID=A0A182NWM7_9DIPT
MVHGAGCILSRTLHFLRDRAPGPLCAFPCMAERTAKAAARSQCKLLGQTQNGPFAIDCLV